MALDIWIYGPGFGEAILLMWDAAPETGGGRRAAFIDSYSTSMPKLGPWRSLPHPLISRWQDAGKPPVAFVAVTHPHLDHIGGAELLMAHVGPVTDNVFWWGGHDLSRMIAFYGKLQQDEQAKGNEVGACAASTSGFLSHLWCMNRNRYPRLANSQPRVTTAMGVEELYIEQAAGGLLRMRSFSPWLGPQTPYTQWLDRQVKTTCGKTMIETRKGVANTTSLGFLLEYGEAQILLGGDVEAENWSEFRRVCAEAPELYSSFDPCLIKIPHHGSPTACLAEMWTPEKGFFRTQARSTPAHCVVTPWRRGRVERQLPHSEIIARIVAAGCHVWLTATGDTGAVDRNTCVLGSHVHFRVSASANRCEMVEQHGCLERQPFS